MTVDRPALHQPRQAEREVRLFASARQEPRARRYIDAITALTALVLLAVLGWWAIPTRDFEQALIEATAASPSWLHNLWVATYDVVALLAIVVLVAACVRSRWPLVLLCLVAAAVAAVIVAVVAWGLTDDWPPVESAVGWDDPVSWPAAALTLASAVLLSVSSDVTAPARRFGGRLLGVAAVAAVLASRTTPTGVIAALLAATAAAAIARLVVGTAAGHLSRQEVHAPARRPRPGRHRPRPLRSPGRRRRARGGARRGWPTAAGEGAGARRRRAAPGRAACGAR